MEALIIIIDWFNDHRWIVRTMAAAVLVMHVIANAVYVGKPVPVSGIVLQEWMAYTNVILVAIWTGLIWGVTSPNE